MNKKLNLLFFCLLCIVGLGLLSLSNAYYSSGFIQILTRGYDGSQGNENATNSVAMSADGKISAFTTKASNLVSNDTSSFVDAFIFNSATSEIKRISVASDGTEANQGVMSGGPCDLAISEDGRYVTFVSDSTDLVPNDNNGHTDVFLHVVLTGDTTRVSVDSSGNERNANSLHTSISANGRYIAMSTGAQFSWQDDNSGINIYIKDTITNEIVYIPFPNASCPSISEDGLIITFLTDYKLVGNDIKQGEHPIVYRFNRETEELTLVSKKVDGSYPTNDARRPRISKDGRYITYQCEGLYIYDGLLETRSLIGNGSGVEPSISFSGQFITFYSRDNTIVDDDTNPYGDIFLYDQFQNNIFRAVKFDGLESNDNLRSAVSDSGSIILFVYPDDGVTIDDTNGYSDVFLYYWGIELFPHHVYVPILQHE